jgi:YD repeat-containing protein
MLAIHTPDVRVERTYDADGRLIEELSASHRVQYQYDGSGLRTGRTTSFGNQVAYTHDADGRVATITVNDHPPIRLERNVAGRITAEHLGEQLRRAYAYDEEGRLVHQRSASALTQIERSYQYDFSGNLVAKQDSRIGTWRYSHDPLGRLIEATDPLNQVRHYTYGGDLAKGIRVAMESEAAVNEDFNLSTPTSTTDAPGAAIAAAREGRRAGPLELDVATHAALIDHFSKEDGASVAELGHEAPELMTRIGLGDGLAPFGDPVSCQNLDAFGTREPRRIEAQLAGEILVQLDEARRGNGRGLQAHIEPLRQAGIGIIERERLSTRQLERHGSHPVAAEGPAVAAFLPHIEIVTG